MAKKKHSPAQAETHKFGAETGKILQFMIHSLYEKKDIFLRELISNASDACDKRRYESLTDESLASDEELHISITIDEENKSLTIADNGIGMDKDELINNLGTIASSGTERFLQSATGDAKKDIQLIGQFGVGFYSAFMVADEVTVASCKAGQDKTFIWYSKADGSYSISEADVTPKTGTTIKLHIKPEAEEFLDKHRIKHIIQTYSDHIAFPVELADNADKGDYEVINKGQALWTLPKNKIEDEQYTEFYKHIAHAGDKPWMVLHNKNEGALEYTNLLFIPSAKPFDLFHPDRATRVKLYVKRVFISQEKNNLVPEYMRFLRGVVDSEDLPLNISRETLQHNNVVHKIKASIVKRVLGELKKKAENEPEEFTKFWNNFGATLKEGLCEGLDANREALMEVCHFRTTKSGDKLITMDEYIKNMGEGQDKIYFLAADSIEAAKNSPQLEGFVKNNIEVILLTDSVDDFWVNVNYIYKDKDIVSITRSGLDLNFLKAEKPTKEEQEKADKDMAEVLALFKETLGAKVHDVRVSKKLAGSPVCLTTQEGGMDIRMERFLVSQKQMAAASPKILEINPENAIVKFIGNNLSSAKSKDLIELLFDEACIIEGEVIVDTGAFSKRFNSFLEKVAQ